MYILAYLEHDIVIILASFPQLINIYTINLTVSNSFHGSYHSKRAYSLLCVRYLVMAAKRHNISNLASISQLLCRIDIFCENLPHFNVNVWVFSVLPYYC